MSRVGGMAVITATGPGRCVVFAAAEIFTYVLWQVHERGEHVVEAACLSGIVWCGWDGMGMCEIVWCGRDNIGMCEIVRILRFLSVSKLHHPPHRTQETLR